MRARKLRQQDKIAAFELASMGPRPCGRGNTEPPPPPQNARLSFNGAAPLRARKLDAARAGIISFDELQWGRALAGAETALPCITISMVQ